MLTPFACPEGLIGTAFFSSNGIKALFYLQPSSRTPIRDLVITHKLPEPLRPVAEGGDGLIVFVHFYSSYSTHLPQGDSGSCSLRSLVRNDGIGRSMLTTLNTIKATSKPLNAFLTNVISVVYSWR